MTDQHERGPALGGTLGRDLGDAWRLALDASARYYQAWGRIAEDYVRDLATAFRSPSLTVGLPPVRATSGRSSGSPSSHRPAPPGPPAPQPAPAMVLVGSPGGFAQGAVLVENHLGHPVTAQVQAELPPGVEIDVDPSVVDLAPGESALVRVRSTLPGGSAGEWRGRLLVPELVGTSVALVVRTTLGDGEIASAGDAVPASADTESGADSGEPGAS
jgi:hypothetical protein